MIYTVECSYADPDSVALWNDFYRLEKLPALISVSGFHTSQRFQALSDGCPTYLAIHTMDGLDILRGEECRRQGGGNFSGWQQHITDWRRNLHSDIGLAPTVKADELLALGLSPLSMHAVALEKCPEHRWLATLPREQAPLAGFLPEGVFFYAPMAEQLRSTAVTQAAQVR
ncbi:sugar ABC transporter [Janthinobacterium sp.]|uniref:sugar ABC transporter n=1 Tax=Janthinobacterium sp. TaxID=1871054 RepID=UPI0026313859|nr:sugar ABC transporter [Janthinobacterium sp.]